MPELPEVETFVRALRRPLVGRTIVGATNDWPRHIVAPLPDELAARIASYELAFKMQMSAPEATDISG